MKVRTRIDHWIIEDEHGNQPDDKLFTQNSLNLPEETVVELGYGKPLLAQLLDLEPVVAEALHLEYGFVPAGVEVLEIENARN